MSEIKVNSIVDASGGSTVQVNGFTPSVSNMAGRNRIINGDMRIDQRNAGASTGLVGGTYYLDRYRGGASLTGKATVAQSSTAPSGFSNSLLVTSSSAYSVGAGETFNIQQRIEGFNFADMAWGTASAATVTLSFWVRSSLTGTFGGAILNSAQDRSYPFSFTVNSADTFEYKTITIAGDTTGTWIGATNGIGAIVCFSLGTGSTYSGTSGAWAGSAYYSATGSTDLIGTSGATLYITGVQLEEGSVATPFEHRQYGQELALCHRYCYVGNSDDITSALAGATTGIYTASKFPTTMRANPSATASGSIRISDNYFSDYTASASVTVNNLGVNGGRMFLTGFSGLTVARFYSGYDAGTGGKLIFSAEL